MISTGTAPARRVGHWIALVAVLWAMTSATLLTRFDEYFWGNFALLLAPHAIVLGVLLIFRGPWAVLAGAEIAMALFLSLFGLWFSTGGRAEAMAWLWYFFSFPGALAGGFLAMLRTRDTTPLIAVSLTASWVFAGMLVDLASVFLWVW
ncbi:hypothetical protein PRtIB026_A30880 [Pseudomonas sp. RtIB026]|uniref:hypothetical protein n=1 Tax=Pseudomonas sp. RtIB026 TaxID=2749999 RepID=UPI00194279B2|nr:hypothetical protein [Pseudomonas sp. RtIB026]BCJ07183.1 hypothetical protein PRtIB026_A30880 [Pseudomonas sp. RtIB026]